MKTKNLKPEADDFGPRRSWEDYGTIQNAIIGLDAYVADLEREWGWGRLRLIAPDDLRARFDRQAQKLNEAVWSEKPAPEVVGQVAAMRRGWDALVASAKANGHTPPPVHQFEFVLSSGTVAVIVRDPHDVTRVAVDGRRVVVYTLDEIRRLLEARPEVCEVKAAFPGATVETAKYARPMDWAHGDDIPFGEVGFHA